MKKRGIEQQIRGIIYESEKDFWTSLYGSKIRIRAKSQRNVN